MAYSMALFALPAALYHLALARVRHDAVLLGIVIAALAVVYLPTSFFIIGEYNATFAAVTAGMAVALTRRENRLGDAVLLCGLGLFCVRSYEAMVYLGPLLAAAIVWSARRDRRPRDQGAGRHRGAGLRGRRRGRGRDHRRRIGAIRTSSRCGR